MANQNVFFVGVARIAGQGIVVGSFSYNTETDLVGVKQVIEQPNLSMIAGKHYSFTVGQVAWHLIQGNITFLLFNFEFSCVVCRSDSLSCS